MINAEEVLVKYTNKIKWLVIKASKTSSICLDSNFRNLFLNINKIQLLYKEGFSHLNCNRIISLTLICNNQEFKMIHSLDFNYLLKFSVEVCQYTKTFYSPNSVH